MAEPSTTEEKRASLRAALHEELEGCKRMGQLDRVALIEREIAALDPAKPKRTGFDEAERGDVKTAQPNPPKEPRRGRGRSGGRS